MVQLMVTGLIVLRGRRFYPALLSAMDMFPLPDPGACHMHVWFFSSSSILWLSFLYILHILECLLIPGCW